MNFSRTNPIAVRHTQSGHGIQGNTTDVGLGNLGNQGACLELTAKQRLELEHSRLGQAAPMIATLLFSRRQADFARSGAGGSQAGAPSTHLRRTPSDPWCPPPDDVPRRSPCGEWSPPESAGGGNRCGVRGRQRYVHQLQQRGEKPRRGAQRQSIDHLERQRTLDGQVRVGVRRPPLAALLGVVPRHDDHFVQLHCETAALDRRRVVLGWVSVIGLGLLTLKTWT